MLDVARLGYQDHVFGDVGGVIADPLEVLGHHDQVDLLGGRAGLALERAQHRLHHLVLRAIDRVVLAEHRARELGVGAAERVERLPQYALRLSRRLDVPIPPELTRLAASAQGVLRRSLDAFSQADPRAAHRVLGSDDEIDHAQDQVIVEEIEQISSHPDMASPAVDIIFIAKNLERVGDHATNIAEDVILVAEARNVKHAAKLAR